MAITIPAGKKVIFRENTNLVTPGIDLLLEEDITLSLQSNFSPLIEGKQNTWLNAFGQLGRDIGLGFSGQFKQMGFQVWETTDPVQMSLTVGLYMKQNAFNDVIQPAKALMRLPLPSEGAGGVLVPPGPSILEALSENSESRFSEGRVISVRIGNIVYLQRVIITKVEPTMSNEVDEEGHPIWIKLAIDIQTLYTATTKIIDDSIGV